MNLLIENIVKINLCLFSINFFIVRTILWATIQTYTTSTIITIRSLYLSPYNLFASHTCLLFISYNYVLELHNGVLQIVTVLFTRSFTQGWLNSYWLYADLQSDAASWSGTFGVSPSQEFFCDYVSCEKLSKSRYIA